jgi:8-oxo-dGTP pyrophosphatase MutT (NUDIX family)
MYKVFFNDSFIGFSQNEKKVDSQVMDVIPYQNLSQIKNWLADAEKCPQPLHTLIVHPKPDLIWQEFKVMFKVLEAAGGLVINKNNEFLFIYKRGKWDLPKGKIDKGEKPNDTAIREVSEETGLTKIKILRKLVNTYHIYRHKDILVLKKIYWFVIENMGSDDLIIQKEEHIEKASWIDINNLSPILDNSYGSINDVFNIYKLQENQ